MSVPKRFGVLRLVGTLMKVVAWIVLIVAILLAIGLGLSGSMLPQLLGDNMPPQLAPFTQAGAGIMAGIVLLIAGFIYFLLLYAAGEGLHLQLAVEENTRLTAALLLRMHQESHQPEPRAGYGASGFASDPFER
ncbi:MAG: hypothetical protein R3C14_13515 [Caldilineaceae bacterium]